MSVTKREFWRKMCAEDFILDQRGKLCYNNDDFAMGGNEREDHKGRSCSCGTAFSIGIDRAGADRDAGGAGGYPCGYAYA